MTEENNAPVLDVRIAFIIDGVVQDVLNTDSRLGAIFLSQPTIVDVSENQENSFVTANWLYDAESQTFTAPPESDMFTPIPVADPNGSALDGPIEG